MIGLGILLLVVAIVLFALGATGVAGVTLQVGKWILIIGVVLFLLFVVLGFGTGHTTVFSW